MIGSRGMTLTTCLFGMATMAAAASSVYKMKATNWPQLPKKYDSRPDISSYCKPGKPVFCESGLPKGEIPDVNANDTLIVYSLKTPDFHFTPEELVKNFDIIYDAIGFHHVQSGLNMTIQWYEIFQLFNCTFPFEPGYTPLEWCNQAAVCFTRGIDQDKWTSAVKVTEISGEIFNSFGEWALTYNNTYPFYETWTVMDKPAGDLYFQSNDRSNFVIQAYKHMHDLGAKFDRTIRLDYAKLVLYSQEPEYVGNMASLVFNPSTRRKLTEFYSYFVTHSTLEQVLGDFLRWFVLNGDFYLFYNDDYWYLPLQEPYLKIVYVDIPMP